MLRPCLCLAVLALFVPVASAQAPSPAEAQTRKLIALLDERIDTKDYVNQMTLKDGIGRLYETFEARKKELDIFINVGNYRGVDPNLNPYDTPVQLPDLPRQLPVRTVLELFVAGLPEPSTFLIRQGQIEILPKRMATIEEMLQRPVTATFENKPLREALQQLAAETGATINLGEVGGVEKGKATVNATFRNNATLQDAIAVVANQAGLRMVVLRNSVYVTTPDNAAQLERDVPPLRATYPAATVAP